MIKKLINENKNIKNILKKKNLNLAVNYLNSFSLSQDNENILLDYIKKSKKGITSSNILTISNVSYEVFNKQFERSLLYKKIKANFFFSDYNNFLSQYKYFKSKNIDVILFLPDLSDFEDVSSYRGEIIYKNQQLREIKDFYQIFFKKMNHLNCKIFVGNFPSNVNLEYGTYIDNISNNKNILIEKLNEFIFLETKKFKFTLINLKILVARFGYNNLRDFSKFNYGRIPFTIEFAEYYYSFLSNLIAVAYGKIKKVLILDLDNTLWGGILGDDGPHGIEIGKDTPLGKAYYNFQKTILNLKNRGILLAISSKNNYKNVELVFKKNKNNLLKLKDFISIKANWENKAKNIEHLSREINLGLDSFVFMDDNPVERDLVRNYLPEVTVPELGDEPSEYSDILLNNFYFDLINYSKEDLSRTKTYLTNVKREKLKTQHDNIGDYLKSLKMSCKFMSFQNQDFDRIVQLFTRSNQFNFTTIRYSLKNIKEIKNNKNKISFQFSFRDCFSDYGITSLMVCQIEKDQSFTIENWVMSCRVLNRTLEQFIINQIIFYCKKKLIKRIFLNYIPTEKNILIKNLPNNLEFAKVKKNKKNFKFMIDVHKYKLGKTYIKLDK